MGSTNLVKTEIPLSQLEAGMTVESDGVLLTVSKNDIKRGGFFGCSFRGDASLKKITRVQYVVPTNKGIVLR